MKASELIKPIEAFAPLSLQENWDNCGFAIGYPQIEVTKALVALDCTEEVMDEAISIGCDIIITHHPMIFKGVKSISSQTIVGRLIEKGIKNNIAVYSAHTNMDKAPNGVSGLMADRYKLINRDILSHDGFGIVGELPEPLCQTDFIKLTKEVFSINIVRGSKNENCKILKVAVCSGSGEEFIPDAIEKGAQIYVTGDIKYHRFFCEKNFSILDIGHYDSELEVVKLFAKILSENFPTFAVYISKENNNPIYYY